MDLYHNGIVLCQQTHYSVIIWVWAWPPVLRSHRGWSIDLKMAKEVWPTEVGHALDQDPSPILNEMDAMQYGVLTDHIGIHVVALLKSLDRRVYRWDQQCCQV